jgi:hypothetical protein
MKVASQHHRNKPLSPAWVAAAAIAAGMTTVTIDRRFHCVESRETRLAGEDTGISFCRKLYPAFD